MRTDADEVERFDRAVVATHADQALALLEDPSPAEREILGAFGYTPNEAVLHTDSSLLPRAAAAHASWNYRVDGAERPTVTYYLNRLQRLDTDVDYLVTLNEDVRDEHVVGRFAYRHPSFTVPAIRAQGRLRELAGTRFTEYAGAYFGNGFHEDGLAAGVRAAAALGVALVRSALYSGSSSTSTRAASPRLPVPRRLLAPRSRRAARARAPAPALLGECAERRHAARRATTSRATCR